MHQSTTFIYKLKIALRSYVINHSDILQNFINFISAKIKKKHMEIAQNFCFKEKMLLS